MFNPTTPHGGGNQTTAPITGASAPVSKVETFRLPPSGQKDPVFGLRRSYLYSLIRSKQIDSIAIRKRGGKRCVRLVNADSLRAFLASQAAEQKASGAQEGGAV